MSWCHLASSSQNAPNCRWKLTQLALLEQLVRTLASSLNVRGRSIVQNRPEGTTGRRLHRRGGVPWLSEQYAEFLPHSFFCSGPRDLLQFFSLAPKHR